MAILPSVPYIRVCVNSMLSSGNAGNLPEYADPDDRRDINMRDGSNNKMSVYIESKTGTVFRFEYYVDYKKMLKAIGPNCLGFFAVIDGYKTSSVVVANENGFKPGVWTHNLNGHRVRKHGSMVMQSFKFAEIELADDLSVIIAPKEISQLGDLVIQVWRVRKLQQVATPISRKELETVPANAKFHEKQLKGKSVSHTTGLGEPQLSSEQETFYKLEYLDPISKPLAEFHFKYRSREILQQMMIIPCDKQIPPVLPRPLTEAPPRNLGQASANKSPPAAMPPLLAEAPSGRRIAAGRDVVKNFDSFMAHMRKAKAFKVPASTTSSAITSKSYDAVTGAFSVKSVVPQRLEHSIPKTTASSMLASSNIAQIISVNSREAGTYQTYPTTTAFESISKMAPGSFSKSGPAIPVETPAKATFRPDITILASAELRSALEPPATPSTPFVRATVEPAVTPFSRVLMDINKSLSQLRDMAKGFAIVNAAEAQDQLSSIESTVRAEVNAHVKPEQTKPEELLKRERAVEDDEVEVLLERPVKRRHIFTEADEIIDLTD